MLIVCAVKDSAMDAFMPLFTVPHVGLAVRGFRSEINKAGSDLAAHSSDYSLYRLATWDEGSGKIIPLEVPELILRGKDAKESA